MSKSNIENIVSLIEKKQPDLFSYEIVDLMDFYNSERNLPRNDEEIYDAVYEIARSIGIDKSTEVRSCTDFNEEKRKTFYRNSRIEYGVFSGKNIVFTGKGPFVRGELMSIARKAGAEISSAVSKRTNLLVVGSKPGSKLRKAKRLNMDIISVEEFFNILEGKQSVEEENSEIDSLVKAYGSVLHDCFKDKNVSFLLKDKELKQKISDVLKKTTNADIDIFDEEKTDILIYQLYFEESGILDVAEQNDIQVMSLGEFNRNLIFLKKDYNLD